jgi:tocopherol O-methyltransferase
MTAEVPLYYSAKTAAILAKYGPGPRVHFHVGLVEPRPQVAEVSAEDLRRRLVVSQETMMDHLAATWGVRGRPPGNLLDVGCGLGGGAIYWAHEHRVRVTALTNIPTHLRLIAEFAVHAGVADRVTPVLADVHQWTTSARYGAAVAVESSGYMDRHRLFGTVAGVLRPNGWFGIQEHFPVSNDWIEILDGYYKTRLGTVEEYVRAASAAGFTQERDDDLSDRIAPFWELSRDWTTRALAEPNAAATLPISAAQLAKSARMHHRFAAAWRDGSVQTRLLLFRRGTR